MTEAGALADARNLMAQELEAGCSLHTLRKTWNEVEAALAALPPAGDDAVLDSYAEENQRLSDQLEAAIATLSQERAAIGWRDISTAPKDGTGILLTDARTKDWTQIAAWDEPHQGWQADDSPAIWHRAMFTHWMPLPSAPQRTGE